MCCVLIYLFIYAEITFTISSRVFLESSTARMYFDVGLSSMMLWITLEIQHNQFYTNNLKMQMTNTVN